MFRRLWRGDDRGETVVEAVIIIPLLVLITLVVVQFALVWHGRHVAQEAAQQAAVAAANYRATASGGRQAGQDYLGDVAPDLLRDSQVTMSSSADSVTADVTARVLTLVPFAHFTVTESASAQVQRFAGG